MPAAGDPLAEDTPGCRTILAEVLSQPANTLSPSLRGAAMALTRILDSTNSSA